MMISIRMYIIEEGRVKLKKLIKYHWLIYLLWLDPIGADWGSVRRRRELD